MHDALRKTNHLNIFSVGNKGDGPIPISYARCQTSLNVSKMFCPPQINKAPPEL